MKSEKCKLCKEDIKTTFLDKRVGTIVKTGEGETSKIHLICKDCQKEHKNDLRKRLQESS